MSGAQMPCVLRAAVPFVYVRLHGPDNNRLYQGRYPEADMVWWADRFTNWAVSGKDVFAYFKNDGYGPQSATHGVDRPERGQGKPMSERYDHRDAEARAQDATEDEVIDRPVLDGAEDLQAEAMRSDELAGDDDAPDGTHDGSVEGDRAH